MHGFPCLRKLEFPVEIAVSNIAAAADRVAASNESMVGTSTDHELDDRGPFIGDLVPPSVSQLTITSRPSNYDEVTLQLIFRNFAAKKDSQLPALDEIHLYGPGSLDEAHMHRRLRMHVEIKRVGVALHLKEWPSTGFMIWDGETMRLCSEEKDVAVL